MKTAVGGPRTGPRPCDAVLPPGGPNGPGFQEAPCGLPQSAGSAPLAGPVSSPFPSLPEGRKKKHMSGGGIIEMREIKKKIKKTNEGWRGMVYGDEL